MADGKVIDGELSADRDVEISGDEASSKISELTGKISGLELENDAVVMQNDEHERQIEKLKASVEELSAENADLRGKVVEAESESKALGAVAARAVELESDVSRLQHDLVSTMTDLQDSNVELSDLKRDLEEMKGREKEQDIKMEAVKKEKDLLLAKSENLESAINIMKAELDGKQKEIQVLKKDIVDFEAAMAGSKSLEKLKDGLEKTVEKMKGEISVLESSLDEKDKVINGFETKERAVPDGVNGGSYGDAVVEDGNKGLIGGWKQRDWVILGGSTVAAVAVMGVACYVHAAKKH